MLAIELDRKAIDKLFAIAQQGPVIGAIDLDAKSLNFSWPDGAKQFPFTLAQFDEALVRAGGWVEFADAKY